MYTYFARSKLGSLSNMLLVVDPVVISDKRTKKNPVDRIWTQELNVLLNVHTS